MLSEVCRAMLSEAVLADLARALVIAMGGVVAGLSSASAYIYWREYRASGRRLFREVMLIRLALIGLSLFGIASVAVHLGHPTLTWRSPVGILTYGLAIVGLSNTLCHNEIREFRFRLRTGRRHDRDRIAG